MVRGESERSNTVVPRTVRAFPRLQLMWEILMANLGRRLRKRPFIEQCREVVGRAPGNLGLSHPIIPGSMPKLELRAWFFPGISDERRRGRTQSGSWIMVMSLLTFL